MFSSRSASCSCPFALTLTSRSSLQPSHKLATKVANQVPTARAPSVALMGIARTPAAQKSEPPLESLSARATQHFNKFGHQSKCAGDIRRIFRDVPLSIRKDFLQTLESSVAEEATKENLSPVSSKIFSQTSKSLTDYRAGGTIQVDRA